MEQRPPQQESHHYTKVLGQKQVGPKTYNIEFLIDKNEQETRSLLSPLIQINTTKKIKNNSDYNIQAQANINGELINIYLYATDIAKACYLLITLGFDLQSITSTNKPLTEKQSQRLIKTIEKKTKNMTNTSTTEQDTIANTNEKKQDQTKLTEQQKAQLFTMSEQITKDMQGLIEKLQNIGLIKKAQTLISEKKTLSTMKKTVDNKLKSQIQICLELMQKAEMDLMQEQQKQEIKNSIKDQKNALETTGKSEKTEYKKNITRKSVSGRKTFGRQLVKRSIIIALIEISIITYYQIRQGNETNEGSKAMIIVGTAGIIYSIRNLLRNKKTIVQILALLICIAITYSTIHYIYL